MKGTLRKLLRLALLAVFLVSTALLLQQALDKRSASQTYDTALATATAQPAQVRDPAPLPSLPSDTEPDTVWIPAPVEDDPEVEALSQISLEALRQVNPDVIGWIRIPGTKVDYPLLQGTDNDYYLNHTWEKKKNAVGSVFLEYRNDPDLMDYNTILYAHNMVDGSMFATLRKYTDRYYWEKHPHVYLLTDAGVLRYDVFASYKAPVDSPTYGLSFQQVQTKADFLLHSLKSSRYDTKIVPEGYDRVLTLSTCTGSGYENRWVVQARLKMIEVQA